MYRDVLDIYSFFLVELTKKKLVGRTAELIKL